MIKRYIFFFIVLIQLFPEHNRLIAGENNDTIKKVLVFQIFDEIGKAALRTTQFAFEEADSLDVDYILLHLNTYGGRVDFADSIRTRLLNSKIPVLAFINNQAISAGALIAISCDSIYMRRGGSIGAATVVNQSGEQVPDKYQSFMRSTMRATAEAHGKDTVIKGNDTIFIWHRDPKVAEAMVDPKLSVPGVSDSGQVLTLTADEAYKFNFSEGFAESINEALKNAGLENAEVYYYKPDAAESIVLFMLKSVVRGILIILIIGGIYFEMQTPGVGFPLGIAVVAALLFFAPLYVGGLVQNWELMVFVIGVVLIFLEIFVIPGFGIAGVLGIMCILTGLTMSLVDNRDFTTKGFGPAMHTVAMASIQVIVFTIIAFVSSIFITRKIGKNNWFKGISLAAVQSRSEGYISIDTHQKDMFGKIGIAYTVLRPSGKIMIENELFDAKSEVGFIDKGTEIKVTRDETGQLYVIKNV